MQTEDPRDIETRLLDLHGDDESREYLADLNAHYMGLMADDLRKWAAIKHFAAAPDLSDGMRRLATAMESTRPREIISEVVASGTKRECELVVENCKLASVMGLQGLADLYAHSGLKNFDITREKLIEDIDGMSEKLERMVDELTSSSPSPK
jgi:hypothetical protein